MTNQRIYWLNLSRLFPSRGALGKSGFFSLFLGSCFWVLPLLSLAQNKVPTITLEQINYLKANAALVLPVKQSVPYREKVVVHFKELGTIYNPTFPETRKRVSVGNFRQEGTHYEYIGKSLSTNRSTVFIRNTGTFYGTWNDGHCCSLIEYEVTRVGEQLQITGKVYSCLVES